MPGYFSAHKAAYRAYNGAMPKARKRAPGAPVPRQRSAKFKRVIILPFSLLIAIGFLLSWLLYINSSRDALHGAISAILRESSDRIAGEVQARLDKAALVVRSNAAFLRYMPRLPDDASYIRHAFVEQLRSEPSIAILSVGTKSGEYLEAQRLSGDEIRVGAAGPATKGSLVFRPVLRNGNFGEPSQEIPNYDPRKRPWYISAAAMGLSWSPPYSLYSNAEPVIAVAMPIYDQIGLIGVTGATITLGSLSDFLSMMKETENGFMFVSDAEGRLVASSTQNLLDADGRRAIATAHPDARIANASALAASALARPWPPDPGRFSFTQGGRRYLARAAPFNPGPNLSWTIVIAVTESTYSARLAEADARNLMLLLFFLGLALLMGWVIVSYITRPIRALAEGVNLLEPGRAIPAELNAVATRDNELGRLSRSFVAMKIRLDESFGALEASLAEKDVLLREVHHRVKNNLQIVSSILSIQSGKLADDEARASFDDCQNRIQAMALVHEEVYRTGSFVELGMRDYLSRICDSLRWGRDRGNCQTDIALEVDQSAVLSLDKAIPCGLVVNELVTNALKHAFPGRACGNIWLSFAKGDDGWRLEVRDDGVGKKPRPAPITEPSAGPASTPGAVTGAEPGSGGLGEQLILALVSQLGGSLDYILPAEGGTSVVVRFPA